MKLFQTKTDNIPKDCKPKKIAGTFDDQYIEYKSEGYGKLSIEQYLDEIRPYLIDMIDNLRASGEWKIQLAMKVTSMS